MENGKRRRHSPVRTVQIAPPMCPPSEVARILAALSFFQDLSESDLDSIAKLFRQSGHGPDEVIYLSGSPARRLYVIALGGVKLVRPTLEGHDVLVELASSGDFFGNLSGLESDSYAETAIAQTAVCLLSIGASAFRALLERKPKVAVRVLRITAERLKASQEMIRRLSAHPVERRIAYVLAKLADRLGERRSEGLLIQLPLSRVDLAEMVGTSTETASRIVSHMQEQGIVATGRRWISILDSAKLLELSGQ